MAESISKILIVGTGAMACLFAARLSAAGIQVTLLDEWEEGLNALAEHGVRLVNPDGTTTSYPVRATILAESCAPAKWGVVLVKSWQTTQAARQLAGCLADDGLAITLQNGLGNREALQAVLGNGRVALGVTTVGATLLAPGVVRQAGDGKITLAKPAVIASSAPQSSRLPQSGVQQSEIASSAKDHRLLAMTDQENAARCRLSDLAAVLESAGFQVEFSDQPEALLWGKLIVNAAINPLTALLNVPNGELLENDSARQVMAAAAIEAARVAVATLATTQGIQLPFTDPVAEAENVARQTATNRSSMLQDILRGAPTEIEAICGAIVREGEVLGIPTPVNWILFNLIKAKVEGNAIYLK